MSTCAEMMNHHTNGVYENHDWSQGAMCFNLMHNIAVNYVFQDLAGKDMSIVGRT